MDNVSSSPLLGSSAVLTVSPESIRNKFFLLHIVLLSLFHRCLSENDNIQYYRTTLHTTVRTTVTSRLTRCEREVLFIHSTEIRISIL